MKISEFFQQAIRNKLPLKKLWVMSVINVLTVGNEYFRIDGKKMYGIINGNEFPIDDFIAGKPILPLYKSVKIDKDTMTILDQSVTTTYIIALINYITLEFGLSGKVKYINEYISVKDIEVTHIIPKFVDNGKEGITVDDRNRFDRTIKYLEAFSEFLFVATTEKMMLPPPNIVKVKEKKIKELKEKYGDDAMSNPRVVIELTDYLKAYDKEWLKGDPSMDGAMTGKIMNNSRQKRFHTMGFETGFGDHHNGTFMKGSLHEPPSFDKEVIIAGNNNLRVGPYARAVSTKDSGVTAESISKALIGHRIIKGDCGTKQGEAVKVLETNIASMIGCTRILPNGKQVKLSLLEANGLMSQTIIIRTMGYCVSKNNDICSTCVNNVAALMKGAPTIIGMTAGGKIVNGDMKSMHTSHVESMEIDFISHVY